MDIMDMEFNEQPLSYAEAVAQVVKYERMYKIRSEDFFESLDKGTVNVDVHPDDLYEWRSYFSFKSDLDARLAALLRENGDAIEEVEYSISGGVQPRMKAHSAAANNNLALAA